MAKLGDLILRVGADTSQLNKNLGEARRSIAKNTREIQNLGRNLTVGVTAPLAIMGATSVQAFREQNKAIAQVEAGLKSTAGQVGFTSQELQKMASDLQNKTLFGDEAILKDATAQLLTFTNISGENFARTQQAALDLATRLDGDLKGASIQLGKALNDPVANLSALSRSGIQFSEDQKAVIKSLTETGNLAEAQTLILDELNKQYGGSAEAAAEADGGFTQLANSFGDLQEEIGRLLVQYLRPIVDRLKTFVQFLQNTSDGTKTVALGIAAVAAAIGPVLLILPNLVSGIKMARAAFALLNTTMLANPFGAVAAAIALVVGGIILLTDETKKAVSAVDALAEANKGLSLEEQKRNIEEQITKQQEIVDGLKAERDAKQALVDQGYGGKAIKEAREANAAYAAATSQLDDMNAMLTNVNEQMQQAVEDANNVAETVVNLGNSTEDTTKKLKDKSHTLGFLMNQLEEVPDTDIWKPVKDSTDQANNSLGALFNRLEETPVEGFVRDLTFMEMFMQAMTDTATSFGNIIGAAFADMISGAKKGKDAMKEMAKALISAALAASQASIIEAMINSGKFTGPAAPIVIPALVASGVALVQGLFSSLPAFADGGIVSGPTLGLVGEYPGASTNPEVIAPLDKLRGMLGGQAVQVHGRLSGRDILLSSEYSAIDRNRVRGF